MPTGWGLRIAGVFRPLRHEAATIGRSSLCAFPIEGARVSRVQAVLELRDNIWWLARVGRGAVVVVNDHELADSAALSESDEIRIAEFSATLERAQPAEKAIECSWTT